MLTGIPFITVIIVIVLCSCAWRCQHHSWHQCPSGLFLLHGLWFIIEHPSICPALIHILPQNYPIFSFLLWLYWFWRTQFLCCIIARLRMEKTRNALSTQLILNLHHPEIDSGHLDTHCHSVFSIIPEVSSMGVSNMIISFWQCDGPQCIIIIQVELIKNNCVVVDHCFYAKLTFPDPQILVVETLCHK